MLGLHRMRSIHPLTRNLRVMKNVLSRQIGQKELVTKTHATGRTQTIVHMNDLYPKIIRPDLQKPLASKAHAASVVSQRHM